MASSTVYSKKVPGLPILEFKIMTDIKARLDVIVEQIARDIGYWGQTSEYRRKVISEGINKAIELARQDERERCANRCKQHKERMDELGKKEAGAVAAFLEHTIRALPDEGQT